MIWSPMFSRVLPVFTLSFHRLLMMSTFAPIDRCKSFRFGCRDSTENSSNTRLSWFYFTALYNSPTKFKTKNNRDLVASILLITLKYHELLVAFSPPL